MSKSLQQRLAVELLEAANLPPSVDGGAPDTFLELVVIPYNTAPPKSLDDPALTEAAAAVQSPAVAAVPPTARPAAVRAHSTLTAMVRNSTCPKWNERFELNVEGAPNVIAPVFAVALRLLERPADAKKSTMLIGGQHVLQVGGHHRQRGCAWLALVEAGELAVIESSDKFLPTVPCVHVAWEVLPDVDPNALDRLGDVSHSTILRRPVTRVVSTDDQVLDESQGNGGGDKSNNSAHPSTTQQHSPQQDNEVLLRLRKLEERLDHLDSIFRVRRDYEAEVQRMMATTAQAQSPNVIHQVVSVVDEVQSVQPSYFSVGSLRSPTMAPGCRPSDAVHFPLRLAHTPSSSGAAGRSSISALQGILLEPTVVSNYDKEAASRYAFKPVPLPEPRKIGFIPTPVPPLVVPPLLPSEKATLSGEFALKA